MARIAFTDIDELVTNQGVALKGGVGINENDLGVIEKGALVWDEKIGIVWLGKSNELPKSLLKGGVKTKKLKGKILSPALVDCHTHLVFAGSRHREFAQRLEGASYQEIAAGGGGIVSSVKATRAASERDLFSSARERLEQMRALGVGIVEAKSGYGLDLATELKQLKVVARLKKEFKSKLEIRSTFLGAHAFPPSCTGASERSGYVDEIVDNMIPQVAKLKLADACDVFFDEGYFDQAQSRRILQAAKKQGLQIKLHADELCDVGGAALAAELGALSADHLLKANAVGLKKMAAREVVAVLLPTTALYLGVNYPDLELMKKSGLSLALATDFNPGSSPSLHLPFVMSLACLAMGMTMAEAFAAATFGGSKALGLHSQHGHLSVGNKPRMAIFNCESYQALISQMAHPGLCERVI